MATRPLNTPYTPRELAAGHWVATALWIVSGALLLMLASWSAAPM